MLASDSCAVVKDNGNDVWCPLICTSGQVGGKLTNKNFEEVPPQQKEWGLTHVTDFNENYKNEILETLAIFVTILYQLFFLNWATINPKFWMVTNVADVSRILLV